MAGQESISPFLPSSSGLDWMGQPPSLPSVKCYTGVAVLLQQLSGTYHSPETLLFKRVEFPSALVLPPQTQHFQILQAMFIAWEKSMWPSCSVAIEWDTISYETDFLICWEILNKLFCC